MLFVYIKNSKYYSKTKNIMSHAHVANYAGWEVKSKGKGEGRGGRMKGKREGE